MEFGDTSDEEAPPPPPKNIDLLKNMQMQIVAMLQGMENDSSLRQGLVTAIAQNVWHGMLHSSLLMELGGMHARNRHN